MKIRIKKIHFTVPQRDLTREGRKFEVEELEVYHISFYEHDFSDDFDIKHRYGKQ